MNTGRAMRIRTVEKMSPKLIETAMGTKKRACNDVSNNKGSRPKMVVKDVSRTGRRRRVAVAISWLASDV